MPPTELLSRSQCMVHARWKEGRVPILKSEGRGHECRSPEGHNAPLRLGRWRWYLGTRAAGSCNYSSFGCEARDSMSPLA